MPLLKEISTSGVAAADRLPYWNDIASRMITPLHVEPIGEAPFEASMAHKKLRECEIMSPKSTPARIFREGECETGVVNIQLQHRGGGTINHTDGHSVSVNEGDFILYDPSRPLWLAFEEPTQSIILRLPRAIVEDRIPHLRDQVGVPISGKSGPGALFSNFLRQAWQELEHGEEGDWTESLGEAIWPLLGMAYGKRQSRAAGNRREERRRALFQVVEAELTNPEFDVHQLARQLAVSARYVQMLFSEIGTTPRAFIQERRLDLAARRLEREGSDVTVTDVAYDAGFNDLSSFCRAFRRRFETSPRNYAGGQRG